MMCRTQRSAAATTAAAGPTLSLHSLITTAPRLESDWVAVEVLMTEPRRPFNLPLSSPTWCSRALFSFSKQRAWKVQCVFRDQATDIKTALMCVVWNCDTSSDQFNEMDQAIIEGGDGGALLGKPLQTFFTEHLGSRKVQLVTVTLVCGCSPEKQDRWRSVQTTSKLNF